MNTLAIYGTSGCARGVLPIVRKSLQAREDTNLVLVDDNVEVQGTSVNGTRCISFEELCAGDIERTRVAIAIAAPRIRKDLAQKCEAFGLGFFDVVAASHLRFDEVEVGTGAILCDHTVITSNIRIVKNFHGNIY